MLGFLNLTACSQSEQVTTTQVKATNEKVTQLNEPRKLAEKFVSKLPKNAPTYKVVTAGSVPPYSFFNEKGELRGLDIDAMQAIAEAGGFKVEFYTHLWQEMFAKVASGEYDMSASGISYTDERAKQYSLSNSYFFSPSAIMVKADLTNVKNFADVKNLSVGVMAGSKQMLQAEKASIAHLRNYATTFLAFQEVIQGDVQATLQDEPPLRYLAKQYPEHKVHIIPYENQKEPSAQQVVLMKKDNQALLKKVNQGIDMVLKNGEMQKIEEKWLGKNR